MHACKFAAADVSSCWQYSCNAVLTYTCLNAMARKHKGKQDSHSNLDVSNDASEPSKRTRKQDGAHLLEEATRTTTREDSDAVLSDEILQEIKGATLQDIMKQGLGAASAEPAVSRPTPAQARKRADRQLKPRVSKPVKKMGITVQPLQSLRVMHTCATRSESATAFLAKRESNFSRKTL